MFLRLKFNGIKGSVYRLLSINGHIIVLTRLGD